MKKLVLALLLFCSMQVFGQEWNFYKTMEFNPLNYTKSRILQDTTFHKMRLVLDNDSIQYYYLDKSLFDFSVSTFLSIHYNSKNEVEKFGFNYSFKSKKDADKFYKQLTSNKVSKKNREYKTSFYFATLQESETKDKIKNAIIITVDNLYNGMIAYSNDAGTYFINILIYK